MAVRLALIGVGKWGTKIEAILTTLPGAELAYTAGRDWKQLLEKDDIDGVIIATPPASHAEIALAFIERGTPVLIEKPMTLSLADADAIVTASTEKAVPVMVGHEHLYSPAFDALKDSLSAIGTVTRIEGREAHDGPVRPDYSTMWDSMPHDLSMMLSLLGMPLSVKAKGKAITKPSTNLYDEARIELTFPNGVTGTIESDWLSKEKVRTLTVFGEQGQLTLDDTLSENKVTSTDGAGTKLVPYVHAWPLTRELEAFVSVIQNKSVPRSNAKDGRATIVVLETAEQSIAHGGEPVLIS